MTEFRDHLIASKLQKDHSYCINSVRLFKEKQDHYVSNLNKKGIEDAIKNTHDSTVSSIIKEEIIIPDDPEANMNQEILLDTSCKQISTDKERKKAFVQKIQEKIRDLNKMKSSNEIKNIIVQNSVINVSTPECNNLKLAGNTIVKMEDTSHFQAETPIESNLEKCSKSEMMNPPFYSTSILKPQTEIINSDTYQNLENSERKATGAAKSVLKVSNLMNDRPTITIDDVSKIKNLKIRNLKLCSQAQSVLKSAASLQVPLILKLPITKASQVENILQMDNVEKDKSIIQVLNMKEKQIVITNSNFTEVKKGVVEADIDEQFANRNIRYYHAMCLTCKKLKQPNNPRDKCKVCQSTFQYECMRCRDVLYSKEEYYNHLKVGEFCSEISIPSFLKNDSYALATRLERYQCSESVWERTQKLVSTVRKARIKLNGGRFNRIKLCCPVCDITKPVENGHFWCKKCNLSSVFKCQTCNRNYTTYSGAIYHTETRVVKKPIYECNECSYKNKNKRSLLVHIRDTHLPKEPRRKKEPSKSAQCPDCNLIIKSSYYWRKHAYSCRERIYFKCTLCSEKYLVKEEITSHLLVAHQMSNSLVEELIKDIEEDRNNQEEEKRQRKQGNLKKNKRPKVYHSSRYITPCCINCNTIYEDLKVSKVTDENNCPKCKSHIRVQCKFCKKTFQRYIIAYLHIKNKCEKTKITSIEKRNNRPNKNATKAKKLNKVNKNTKEMDLDINNQFSHSILGDLAFMSNDKELENNSTLEENEMQLMENVDVKVENQDIKVFDGLLNFDNYEVIIPDMIHD